MTAENSFENDPRLLASLEAATLELQAARMVAQTIETRIVQAEEQLDAARSERASLSASLAAGVEPPRMKVLEVSEGYKNAEAELEILMDARKPAAQRVRAAENQVGMSRRQIGLARVARLDAVVKDAEIEFAMAKHKYGLAKMAADNARARL